MKRNEAFPSSYLTKEDCNPPIRVTISGAELVTLEGDEGAKTKPILKFKEDVKSWVIPNCMWMLLESTYGADSDDWIGKRIELYCDDNVMFGKKRVGGIRCHVPSVRPAAQQAAPRQHVTTNARQPAPQATPAQAAPHPDESANFDDIPTDQIPF